MNNLLIFFAIPLATIILSSIFETILNCPFKVAGIFFSIFIVVVFALGGTAELIVTSIVYTIISYIAALITKLFTNRNSISCLNSNSCASINSYTNTNSCTNTISTPYLTSEINLDNTTNSNLNTKPLLGNDINTADSNFNCRRYRY